MNVAIINIPSTVFIRTIQNFYNEYWLTIIPLSSSFPLEKYILFHGFSSAEDGQLGNEAKLNYEAAMTDFDTIKENYAHFQ